MHLTRTRASLGAALLVTLVATGCAAAEPEVTPAPESSETTAVELPVETPTPTPTPTMEPTVGSREAPLQLGEPRAIEDGSAFVVGISDAIYNAMPEVSAHSGGYAEQPPSGWTFIRGTMSVTLDSEALRAQHDAVEEEGMDLGGSITPAYIGSNGQSYDIYSNTLCTVSNEWWDVGPIFTYDASLTANLCISVPTDAIPGGMWRISNVNNEAVWVQGAE